MINKLNIGIIGTGRIGMVHAHNISQLVPNAQLVAIADPYMTPEQKKTLIGLGIPPENIFSDPQKLIHHKLVEAIVICTPTYLHLDYISKIIKEVKKPIFCEKPLSKSWKEDAKLLKKVEDSNVYLQVGYNRRFDNNFKEVHEVVNEGRIGRQYIIEVTSYDPSPPPLSYVKDSGMMWTDMNIHDFDMIRYVSGAEITKVSTYAANLIAPEFKGYDVDVSVIQMKLSNGALGVIKASRQASYGYDQRIEVLGSLGRVKIDNVRPTTTKIDQKDGRIVSKGYDFFIDRYPQAYQDEIIAFVKNVFLHREGKPIVPLPSMRDDLAALKVAAACEISYKEKRTVKLSELI